ncbi:MAG: beta-ketoacyl synthase N-terminal-like domain-containing protein [Acidobacteriota bacterium]
MKEVVITGRGAISPFGDAQQTALGTAEGRIAYGPFDDRALARLDRSGDPSSLRARAAGRIEFNPREAFAGRNFRPVDRTGQLAILAAEGALAALGAEVPADERRGDFVGLVLGTMFGSVHTISAFDRRGLEAGPKYVKPLDFANSVINAAAGQAAIWLGLTGTNSTVTGGAAAGVLALAQATQLIRDGRARTLLAGGAEELSFEAMVGFEQAGRLSPSGRIKAFDRDRDGTVLGEGAALLLMEDAESAAARSATPLARVAGYGSAFDTSRGRDPERGGAILARAITLALDAAGLGAGEIDAVFTGARGAAADAVEGRAVASVFGRSAPVTAVASSLGCCLGASGAFQALGLLHAFETGDLPAIAGLERPDDAWPDLDLCQEPRRIDCRRGLLTATSGDGVVVALVLERAGD